MSEKPARQPMTDGEREILFQIQQLQAKWFDTIEMCSHRESYHWQGVLCISPQKGSIQFLVLQIMSQY